MTGFIFGLAITIVVGQLPKLLGVPSVSGSVPDQLRQLVAELPEHRPVHARDRPRVAGADPRPAPDLEADPRPADRARAGAGRGAACSTSQDKGVSVVGDGRDRAAVDRAPDPACRRDPACCPRARPASCSSRSASRSARAAASRSRHRYEIDADQELLALGAANIASGLFGGFTTDASLSQTATAEAAGAKSQLSSLVTAGLILATAVFLAPLFADLPNAVLGAIVIAASLSLMDVAEMRRYWAWRRTDFLIAVAALVGVLLTTVLIGPRDRRAALGRLPAVSRQPAVRRGPRTHPGLPQHVRRRAAPPRRGDRSPTSCSSASTRRCTSSTRTSPRPRSSTSSPPATRRRAAS